MHASKLILFTLLLVGCGSHSSSPQAALTDFDMQVDASSFDSTPGKFSSLYKGACIITTSGTALNPTPSTVYDNCKTTVRVIQVGSHLTVRTSFSLTASDDASKNIILSGRTEDDLLVSGSDLLQGRVAVGLIGAHGFKYQREGDQYYFARLYPDHYKFEGSFVSDSGQVVHIVGAVQRGSPMQASSSRVNRSNP